MITGWLDTLWVTVVFVLLAGGVNVACVLIGFRLGRITADKAADIAIKSPIGGNRPIDIPASVDEFVEAQRQYHQGKAERMPTL